MVPRWFLKLAFHLLYYQLAWTYEWVAWAVSFGQWASWRRLAMLYLRPGPTLELAYGTGRLFGDMLRAGYRPVGIDLSPYMARMAHHHLRRDFLFVDVCRANAQALPFPDNHFANIVATFPSDYIFHPDTLREIHRVLHTPTDSRPAGRLIVVAEGLLRGPQPVRGFIDWLYRVTNQRGVPMEHPLNLIRTYHFEARWETPDHDGAQARILIAEKL